MEALAMVGFGAIIALLVMFIVGVLFGALILKFVIKLLEKFSPSFGKSLLVVILAGIVGFVVYMVLAMAMGMGSAATMDPNDPAAAAGMMGAAFGVMGLSMVANLLIYAGFIHLLVKRPDGSAYGFGRGLLASLLYLIVMTVLGIIFSIVLAVIFGAALGGMAGMAG